MIKEKGRGNKFLCSQGKGIVDQSYFSIVMMMMMMMKTMLKMMKTLSIMIQDQKIRSGINPFNKNLNSEIFEKGLGKIQATQINIEFTTHTHNPLSHLY